jgi:hypothetical protein
MLRGYVTPSPSAWAFLSEDEPLGDLPPDLVRLVGDVLLNGLLHMDFPTGSGSLSGEGVTVGRREPGVDPAPLERFVAGRADEGLSGSRIFTSPHLWEDLEAYEPVFVGSHAHVVVLETEETLMHSSQNRGVMS